jgi:hypothetical protein
LSTRLAQLHEITARHGACVDAAPDHRNIFISPVLTRDAAEDALAYCARCPVRAECEELVMSPPEPDAPDRCWFDGIAGGQVWSEGLVKAVDTLPRDGAPVVLMVRALGADGWPWRMLARHLGTDETRVGHWSKSPHSRPSEGQRALLVKAYNTLPTMDPELLDGRVKQSVTFARNRALRAGWLTRSEVGDAWLDACAARRLIGVDA